MALCVARTDENTALERTPASLCRGSVAGLSSCFALSGVSCWGVVAQPWSVIRLDYENAILHRRFVHEPWAKRQRCGRLGKRRHTMNELRKLRSAYNARFGLGHEALSTNKTFCLEIRT